MPLPIVESTPATLAVVEPYQRPAITPRGVAALRLSEFQDVWAELTAEDRAWFAHWLTELLVDACLEAPPARRDGAPDGGVIRGARGHTGGLASPPARL